MKKIKYFCIGFIFITLLFVLYLTYNKKGNHVTILEKQILNTLRGESSEPRIAASDNGAINVFWLQDYDQKLGADAVCFCYKLNDKWSKPEVITGNNYPKSNPSAVSGNSGEISLVWGEKRGVLENGSRQPATDILYSMYKEKRWQKPEILFHIEYKNPYFGIINWSLKKDNKNVPVLFFESALDTSKIISLNLMKKSNNNWTETTKIVDNPAYSCAEIDNENEYHVAFIKSANTGSPDVNSVFYTFSRDEGKTFSKPFLVHQSGSQAAYDLRMCVDSKNIIHLVYRKSYGKDNSEVLIHAYSSDGIVWKKEEIFTRSTKVSITNLDVIAGADNISVFWIELNKGSKLAPSAYFSTKNDDKWEQPMLISENILKPSFSMNKTGILNMVFWDKTGLEKRPYPLTYIKTLLK